MVSYTLTESSASRVKSKSVQIESDGKQITLEADLEAGPVVDQNRGWLKARLQMTQVPRDVSLR